MKHLRVNGHDMAFIDVGAGPAIVCVHGSLGDFRVWSGQMGPLSRAHRVIAVSLRYFFPTVARARRPITGSRSMWTM